MWFIDFILLFTVHIIPNFTKIHFQIIFHIVCLDVGFGVDTIHIDNNECHAHQCCADISKTFRFIRLNRRFLTIRSHIVVFVVYVKPRPIKPSIIYRNLFFFVCRDHIKALIYQHCIQFWTQGGIQSKPLYALNIINLIYLYIIYSIGINIFLT